jgi:hypothetical protein
MTLDRLGTFFGTPIFLDRKLVQRCESGHLSPKSTYLRMFELSHSEVVCLQVNEATAVGKDPNPSHTNASIWVLACTPLHNLILILLYIAVRPL